MVDAKNFPGRTWGWIRKNGAGTGIELLINFLLPFLIYTLGKRDLGDVHALMASSIPPVCWSIIELVRKRRVDVLSMMVLGGIALSLLAFIGGGGARFLLLRERLVTALVGLIFLGSALIGKPLIYELSLAALKRRSAAELPQFVALRSNGQFRRLMTVLTLVWGIGLLGEAAIAVALVFSVSITTYLLLSPFVGFGTVGVLAAFSWWYARRFEGAAKRKAAEIGDGVASESPPPSPVTS